MQIATKFEKNMYIAYKCIQMFTGNSNNQFHTPCKVVEGYPCGLGSLAVAAPAEGPGCCPCPESSKVWMQYMF